MTEHSFPLWRKTTSGCSHRELFILTTKVNRTPWFGYMDYQLML